MRKHIRKPSKSRRAGSLLRSWSIPALLLLLLASAAGCVTDEIATNAEVVLDEIDAASAPSGNIEIDGSVLVYSDDLPDLVSGVRSVDVREGKIDLVMDYLTLQERIDCILDNVEQAAEDEATIQCQGKVLIWVEGEHGLLGVSQILDEVKARDGGPPQRAYLSDYLSFWDEVQRVERVVESLGQIQRSNSIPLFGSLLKSIHRFPILYEGDELVPYSDVPGLLEQYRARDTEDARRDMVKEYLER